MDYREKMRRELENLKNQEESQKDPMQTLYHDLFGGSLKPGAPFAPVSGPDPAEIKKNEQMAVDQANKALNEARKLLEEMTIIGENPIDILNSLPGNGGKDQDQERPAPGPKNGAEEEPKPEAEKTPAKEPAGSHAAEEKEAAPAEPEKDPIEELDALIGLTTIKHDVKELADFVKIQKLRKEQGMKSVPVSLHLVFTGNPGTGKTTVARILSRIYQKIGVLSKGQLVEVDRSGLVAGYVGQTALKTQEQISKAMGGILFIDEAYSLAQKDDAFGQEAIDTILKAMEDNRDDLVVIVAGYTRPMEKFINSNPGLKSRFNKYIEFPDYTIDELEQIFQLNCRKYDYQMDDDVKRQIREMIKLKKLQSIENFANAREVRNLFEEVVTNQARRIAAIEDPTHEDIVTILMEDLTEKAEKAEEPEKAENGQDPEAKASGDHNEEGAPAEEAGEKEA